jgi:hypothetical protein
VTVPTFLVAGGARCGTTGLVEGLRLHPDVFVTRPKEPHYFALHSGGAHFTAPGDDHTINRVAVTERDAYLRLYPERHHYRALGEGSVSTLYYAAEAVPEALLMNPRMKFVVLLREPVARAYSAHQYMVARGLEPVPDFLEAVGLEEQRRRDGWHHIWHYTAMSRYADSLQLLQESVPPDQLGVWFHDDLDAAYGRVLGKVLDFLGVDPPPADLVVPRVNVSGRPRFAPLHATIGWATRHERIRAIVKRSTSYRFRERVRRSALTSDPVPAEARSVLEPVFADDLGRLRLLLRQPTPAWLDVDRAVA